MSLLAKLPDILEKSRNEYEKASAGFFVAEEIFAGNQAENNWLVKGDNFHLMKNLIRDRGMGGKINMIYIDPPFFSQADYGAQIQIGQGKESIHVRGKAYSDTWERGMEEYLHMLCLRFLGIHQLLAEDGCLWLHLDWHSVHYVKILLDEIFGAEQFINEVIWNYKSGGTSKKHFSRKHDTLLFYAKTQKYFFQPIKEKSYNRGMKPYRFKGVQEYRDEMGWHTLVNMKDVWQIDMVGRTSGERTGYATQKPEALLERILTTCTRPGDLCADFFSGSGTLASVASKMDRNWICCDQGSLAVVHTISRLIPGKAGFTYFESPKALSFLESSELELETSIDKVDENQSILTVKIKNFKPKQLEESHARKKDREAICQLLREDPLKLIEYWSVDFQFDGSLHKGNRAWGKKNENQGMLMRGVIRNQETISLKLVDSFGRVYRKIIQVEGGSICLK